MALCTINGEKFIQEQLESIIHQTMPPAEIVVCDDCSTDSTISLIEMFSKHSSIPIYIHRNEQQLGVTGNFRKAISLCREDLIALSDQDDFWLTDKLEKQAAFLQKHIEAKVVFTNLLLVNEKLESLKQTMWDLLNFNRKLKAKWRSGEALEILTRFGNVVTGSTIMFRSSCRASFDKTLEYKGKIWIHDGLIALVSAKENSISFLDEVTVLYRQHSAQVIGVAPTNPVSTGTRLKKLMTGNLNVINELEELLSANLKHKDDLIALGFSEGQLSGLNNFIRHLKVRRYLPVSRVKRILPIVKEWISLRYYKYSGSLVFQAIRDWLVKRSLLLA